MVYNRISDSGKGWLAARNYWRWRFPSMDSCHCVQQIGCQIRFLLNYLRLQTAKQRAKLWVILFWAESSLFLLRESALVAAGHVCMCTNRIESEVTVRPFPLFHFPFTLERIQELGRLVSGSRKHAFALHKLANKKHETVVAPIRCFYVIFCWWRVAYCPQDTEVHVSDSTRMTTFILT